jgi:predicted permease
MTSQQEVKLSSNNSIGTDRRTRWSLQLEATLYDVRYALRMLRKAPAFALVTILTLAMGIGLTTAVFTVVNGILLQPLPYKSPGSLIAVFTEFSHLRRGPATGPASGPDFLSWQNNCPSLSDLIAFTPHEATLTEADSSIRLGGLEASPKVFELLGTGAALGRVFLPEDSQVEQSKVVILSHAAWQRLFDSDEHIVGRALNLDGELYTVVGVMPAGFRFPEYWAINEEPDFFLPLARSQLEQYRGSHEYGVLGRLAPGVALSAAQAELKVVAERLARQFPETDGQLGVRAIPLKEVVTHRVRSAILLIQLCAAFLLLIACVNVASLSSSRSLYRQGEIATRQALGAGRARLIQQLLTESVILFLLGGAGGLAIAYWCKHVLLIIAPPGYLPEMFDFPLDPWILGAALGLSLITGVIFGVYPAIRSSRSDLQQNLRKSKQGVSKDRRRTGQLLVIAEIAMAEVLLIVGGLMIYSLRALLAVDVGFEPQHLTTIELALPTTVAEQPEKAVALLQELQQRLDYLPGIKAVAFTSKLPLHGGDNGNVMVEGAARPEVAWKGPLVEFSTVTPRYFRAAGIPIVTGRDFSQSDIIGDHRFVIVNKAFDREFWPNANPLGQHVSLFESPPVWCEVIGVVSDVRQWGLRTQALPEVYFPDSKEILSDMSEPSFLVVRSTTETVSMIKSVEQTVWKVNSQVPLWHIRTGEQLLSDAAGEMRYRTQLLTAFGIAALVLAMVGVYGTVSFVTARRTQEIGVRVALGAQRSQIVWLVMESGLRIAIIGCSIGLAGAFLCTRLLTSLLFQVKPEDPAAFAAAFLVLMGVAMVACYIPARCAMRVDPLVALRYE